MNRITFNEGILLAIILAIAANVLFFGLSVLLGHVDALRLTISITSFVYGGYLIVRSTERSGYVLTATVWALVSFSCWLVAPGIVSFVAVHLALIWLTRAMYWCTSPITALLDLALQGIALLAAVWGGINTNSVLVTVWCFFLVQALFIWLPTFAATDNRDSANVNADTSESNQAFADALAMARAAARKLANT